MAGGTIFLVRHGKPSFWSGHTPFELITASRYSAMIDEYNFSGIDCKILPENPGLVRAKQSRILFASDLKRALDSATAFGHPQIIVNQIFREADMPRANGNMLLLPLGLWIYMQRIRWFLGNESNCESYEKFKIRARAAAEFLHSYNEYESITVVAHGFINWFIAKELKKLNWRLGAKGNNGYFGVTELYA